MYHYFALCFPIVLKLFQKNSTTFLLVPGTYTESKIASQQEIGSDHMRLSNYRSNMTFYHLYSSNILQYIATEILQ